MAMSNGWDDQEEPISDINMTPLVDVMLVLLIIFIITMPVLTHSVQLNLPQASSTPHQVKPETLTLAVNAEGAVYWGREPQPLARQVLQQRLADLARQPVQPEVHIYGDRQAAYDHVLQVMAAAQRAGILKLGFVMEPAG